MDAAIARMVTPGIGRRSTLATALLIRLGEVTNRTFELPLLIFYPTSRCNSRCISCDWWQHGGQDDLTLAEIDDVAAALPALGTRIVAFSGGEPLLRPEVFQAADLFRARGVQLHLLTSAVLLDRFAPSVATAFDRVTISLDATTEALYQAVRGIAALATVERGVTSLRRLAPRMPVTARATLHRANFRELPRLIERAKAMSLDGISFLAADLGSTAFGRERPPDDLLRLSGAEIAELELLVEETIARYHTDFESGFVSSRHALRRLPKYYAALDSSAATPAPFPPVACNAPWVSVVLEADGNVRPCFFHAAVGNVRHQRLASIVGANLRLFRRGLDVSSNPVCRRCVCSLRTGWRSAPWH